jgi:hypothetical protein
VDLRHDDREDDNAEGDNLNGGIAGENEADDTGESTSTASHPG